MNYETLYNQRMDSQTESSERESFGGYKDLKAKRSSLDALWGRYLEDGNSEPVEVFLEHYPFGSEAQKATAARSLRARIAIKEKGEFVNRVKIKPNENSFSKVYNEKTAQYLDVSMSRLAGQLVKLEKIVKTQAENSEYEDKEYWARLAEGIMVEGINYALSHKENYGLKDVRELAEYGVATRFKTPEVFPNIDELISKKNNKNVIEPLIDETFLETIKTEQPADTRQWGEKVKHFWSEVKFKKDRLAQAGLVAVSLIGFSWLLGGRTAEAKQIEVDTSNSEAHITETSTPLRKPDNFETPVVVRTAIPAVDQVKKPVHKPEVQPKPEVERVDHFSWLTLDNGKDKIDLSKGFSIHVSEETARKAGKKEEIEMKGEVTVNTFHDPNSEEVKNWNKQFEDWVNRPDLMGVQQGDNGVPIIGAHSGDLWLFDFQGDWVRTSSGFINPETGKPYVVGEIIKIKGDNGQTIEAEILSIVVVKTDSFMKTQRWFEGHPDKPPMLWSIGSLKNSDLWGWDDSMGDPDAPLIAEETLRSGGVHFLECGGPGWANAKNLDEKRSIMSLKVISEKTSPENDEPVNSVRYEIPNLKQEAEEIQKHNIQARVVSPEVKIDEVATLEVVAHPEVSAEHLAGNELAKDVIALESSVNEYKDTHADDDPEKLGDFIKKSEWYKELSAEKQQQIEPALRMVNSLTNSYSDIKTGEKQPIQCLWYEALIHYLGDEEGPTKNLGGVKIGDKGILLPGEALAHPDYGGFKLRVIDQESFEEINKGDMLINTDHVAVVISAKKTEIGWEIVVTDANKDRDGRARIRTLYSPEDLRQFLESDVVWFE